MKVLLAVLFSFQAYAGLDNQPAFSYEDCMTSGENRESQRSICNVELRQSILALTSAANSSFESNNTEGCDAKNETLNTLDIYYQYVALMQYGSIDSSGLTANQVEESISRIQSAHSKITALCN